MGFLRPRDCRSARGTPAREDRRSQRLLVRLADVPPGYGDLSGWVAVTASLHCCHLEPPQPPQDSLCSQPASIGGGGRSKDPLLICRGFSTALSGDKQGVLRPSSAAMPCLLWVHRRGAASAAQDNQLD